MKALQEKIEKEGQAISADIIKVDTFLNHQIDVAFLDEMGKVFGEAFADAGANKILTVEASGIAVAIAAARYLGNIPVVFGKKAATTTTVENSYTVEVTSFTRRRVYTIFVSKEFLGEEDRVLIIDDFLAHGEAAQGMIDLVEQAGGSVVGIGAVIDKEYQGGSTKIRKMGIPLESLAVIKSIEDGKINFR